jgi:hypothetical protein
MQSIDVFHYVVSLCAIVFVGVVAWVGWHIVETLKIVQSVVDRLDDTARDFTMVKDGIKAGVFTLIGKLLVGGGDKK